MDRRSRIEARLRAELAASHVDVEDESHRHAGHAGAASGGGHFRATIVSDRFAGLSRVARQRLVYGALAAEMKDEIHALAMRTFTREEWAAER
jgi:BolA family transcriptional regulator, general stress-responsive regulator